MSEKLLRLVLCNNKRKISPFPYFFLLRIKFLHAWVIYTKARIRYSFDVNSAILVKVVAVILIDRSVVFYVSFAIGEVPLTIRIE